MNHGSLFSGIGGFDLAAEWMGWNNIFHCEWNEFGKKVLHHYWPNAIQYHDITKTDFTIHRGRIDILTGGFPCQPYSSAGKRLGKDDERHLWPEMLRAIREIQPRWIVGENVLGLTNWNGGLVFHEVQVDLEAAGYEVQPFILPACAVNAPHRRDRVWFVAKNTNEDGWGGEQRQGESDKWGQRDIGAGDHERVQAYNGEAQNATNTDSDGQQRGNGQHEINTSERWQHAQRYTEPGNDHGDAADTNGLGLLGKGYGVGKSKQLGENSKRKDWQNFPTQSPVCGGDDGLPRELDGITFSKWRAESIKAYGNAVVPQLVFQIFTAIQQYEEL